jgi:periplasmic protein TonB
MLDYLVASAPAKSWSLPGTLVSLLGHGIILYAAIHATVGRGGAPAGTTMDTTMVFVQPESPTRPPSPPDIPAIELAGGFKTVVAPATIPTDIPPIDLKQRFEPGEYRGLGPELPSGAIAAITGDAGPNATYSEAAVDEKPEILTSPRLDYPNLLRQAGVEGSALVEAIIDTSGRAERGSVRIVHSTHPAFDKPAMDVVAGSIYRPGRMRGAVVRVLVNVPVNFSIRKTA